MALVEVIRVDVNGNCFFSWFGIFSTFVLLSSPELFAAHLSHVVCASSHPLISLLPLSAPISFSGSPPNSVQFLTLCFFAVLCSSTYLWNLEWHSQRDNASTRWQVWLCGRMYPLLPRTCSSGSLRCGGESWAN